MKAFEEEIALTNRRQACVCGQSGANGQPGVSCSEQSSTTKMTTVKGTTPPPSHSGTSTSAASGASIDSVIPRTSAPQVGESQVVKVVTKTRTNSRTRVVTHTMSSTQSQLPSVITVTATWSG
jgi:hypothetical protein